MSRLSIICGVLMMCLLVLNVTAYTKDELELRSRFNVAHFRSKTFSASFLIFVGTAIVLIGGLLLATCALYEIEPGKDSLVYRGANTRAKVE